MMKISKTMFIVLLTVFCLTIMVVSAIPSSSTVSGYDPTLDINHDGVINMKDLGTVARAFNPTNTGNDPTVPVNVTNFPLDAQGNLKTSNYVPSGTFNTSCMISVETTSVIGQMGVGQPGEGIYVEGAPAPSTSFFFVFNPLTPDFNVSGIVVQCILYSSPLQQSQIFLNGINVGTLNIGQGQVRVTAAPITQVQTLQLGINYLALQPQSNLWLQELSLFVNYQYTE